MKLLIVTQKVDRRDPVLGFFHRWIEEFSKHCEKVTVIGQFTGTYNFPDNVEVLSLGKERGASRAMQMCRFWYLIWAKQKQYDTVFVHMVPLWIVMGCDSWIVLRKRMYLWYEARGARWPLKVALLVVRKVFSASKHGMPITTKKSVITGHGIDTERYAPGTGEREKGLLLTVSRITRAKKLHVLVQALSELPREFHLTIVGAPITKEDEKVITELRDLIMRLNLKSRVVIESLSPKNVLPLLQRAEVFIHASETSLDKSILEAMSCGCLTLSSSNAAATVLPPSCQAKEDHFAESIQHLASLASTEQDQLRHKLRETIMHSHSLPKLVDRLVTEMRK